MIFFACAQIRSVTWMNRMEAQAADDAETVKQMREALQEVEGGLYTFHDLDVVFDGICDAYTDEDFINDKAEALGLADEYNHFSYSGESEALDHYLEAWDYVIDHIFSGEITEENLDSWLGYFDTEYSDSSPSHRCPFCLCSLCIGPY